MLSLKGSGSLPKKVRAFYALGNVDVVHQIYALLFLLSFCVFLRREVLRPFERHVLRCLSIRCSRNDVGAKRQTDSDQNTPHSHSDARDR